MKQHFSCAPVMAKTPAFDCKGVLLPGTTWEQPAPTKATHVEPFDQIHAFVIFVDQDSRGWAKTERGDLVRLRVAVEKGW
jgi:hypothetical protein